MGTVSNTVIYEFVIPLLQYLLQFDPQSVFKWRPIVWFSNVSHILLKVDHSSSPKKGFSTERLMELNTL